MFSPARWVQVISDFFVYIIFFIILTSLFSFIIIRINKSSLSYIWRGLIVGFCFTCIFFYVTFFCFEAYYRYLYDQSDALGFLKTNQHWLAKHVVYNNVQLRDNKNYVVQKKPGVVRIGVIGDSLAFGYGIKHVEDRFSNQLEKKLQKAGKKVEVYTIGISGYDTCGEIQLFKKMKYLQFDIMVWEFYLNDIQPCKNSTGTRVIENTRKNISPAVAWLSDKSYFFDYLYWKLSVTHNQTFRALRHVDLVQYYNPSVVKTEKESVAKLYEELKGGKEGKRPVVVIIFPYLYLLGENYPGKHVHTVVHSMLSDAGATKVIDLLPDLVNKQPKDIVVNSFDPHPNEAVNQLAADKLYHAVLPLIK